LTGRTRHTEATWHHLKKAVVKTVKEVFRAIAKDGIRNTENIKLKTSRGNKKQKGN
jgi:hypothetical protein